MSSSTAAGVFPQVCGIDSLAADTFDGLPTLANSRRNVGVLDLLIDSGSELSKGRLDKMALLVACTEEDSVDAQQNPGALGESESREE